MTMKDVSGSIPAPETTTRALFLPPSQLKAFDRSTAEASFCPTEEQAAARVVSVSAGDDLYMPASGEAWILCFVQGRGWSFVPTSTAGAISQVIELHYTARGQTHCIAQ